MFYAKILYFNFQICVISLRSGSSSAFNIVEVPYNCYSGSSFVNCILLILRHSYDRHSYKSVNIWPTEKKIGIEDKNLKTLRNTMIVFFQKKT